MNRAASAHRSKAEYVTQQLLERIIAAKLKPGASFATEVKLLSQFKVSRPTLRESLKFLESQGALDHRPGPGGGILVGRPSIDLLVHSLSVFLRLHEVPFFTVLKAREVIEPALAYEAAVNGTEEDFAELESSIERMKALDAQSDQQAFLEENRVFHSVIARASDNKVLEVFWNAISILAAGWHHGIRYSVGNQAHVAKAHRRWKATSPTSKTSSARYQHLLKYPTSVVERPGRAIA